MIDTHLILGCFFYPLIGAQFIKGGGAFWENWHVLEIDPQRSKNALQEIKFEWKICKAIFIQQLIRFLSISLNSSWLMLHKTPAKITRKSINKNLKVFWHRTTVFWPKHGNHIIHTLLLDRSIWISIVATLKSKKNIGFFVCLNLYHSWYEKKNLYIQIHRWYKYKYFQICYWL